MSTTTGSPAVPPNAVDLEANRLAALDRLEIMGTGPERCFDRLARLAGTISGTPAAMITLVGRDSLWLKAAIGIDVQHAPREGSFCTVAIGSERPFIVPDAARHAAFRNSRYVTQSPHIRFYMGAPLRSYDGHNVGMLCVTDTVPRRPTQQQVQAIRELADVVVDEFELRQIADIDVLTGLMTRRSFIRDASRLLDDARRRRCMVSCLAIDVDHFKRVNDSFGHAAGDRVLRAVASRCRQAVRGTDIIGRLGGEEFVTLLPDTSWAEALAIAERVRSEIAADVFDRGDGQPVRVTVSVGVSACSGAPGRLDTLLQEADAALYVAKRTGRNRVAATGLEGVAGSA